MAPLNWNDQEKFTDDHEVVWNPHWHSKNQRFEDFLLADPGMKSLSKCMFFVWDDNHKLQAWLPYIQLVHNEDLEWHYLVDSIVLYIVHGLVKFLIAMINMNKLVFHLSMNP